MGVRVQQQHDLESLTQFEVFDARGQCAGLAAVGVQLQDVGAGGHRDRRRVVGRAVRDDVDVLGVDQAGRRPDRPGDHQCLVVRGDHHGHIGRGRRPCTNPAGRRTLPPPPSRPVLSAPSTPNPESRPPPPTVSRELPPASTVKNTSQPHQRPESRADAHHQHNNYRDHQYLRIIVRVPR